MNRTRDKILASVKIGQPKAVGFPELSNRINKQSSAANMVQQFTKRLEFIGGAIEVVSGLSEVQEKISLRKEIVGKVINYFDKDSLEFTGLTGKAWNDVDMVLLKAQLGVAENGAVWLTDDDMIDRVLPCNVHELSSI